MSLYYVDSGGASTNSGSSDNNSPDASGTGNATTLANKTFASATDVDTTNNRVTVTGHGYSTAMGVFLTTSSALPAPLNIAVLYFLRAIDANTLAFYPTAADANADTNRVDLTSVGTGTQTINNYTVQLGGSPSLSGMLPTHCRLTTSGTSHVITYDLAHGLTTGDAVYFATPGAVPTGATFNQFMWVNVLSSTTIRVYSSLPAALAGGASTFNLSATTSALSIFPRDQARPAINLASATNTNRKIFPIRQVDDTNKWVIVDTGAVTGLGAGSNWAIGGRISGGGIVDLVNCFRPGDKVLQNTDISAASLNSTFRIGNSSLPILWTGKSGAVRALVNTSNGVLFTNTATTSPLKVIFQNVDLQCQGTGSVLASNGNSSSWYIFECKITDAGASGMTNLPGGNQYNSCVRSEISGCSTSAINGDNVTIVVIQSYIHNNTGPNIQTVDGPVFIIGSIVERSASDGIQVNILADTYIVSSTIYHNDGNGYSHASGGAGTSTLHSLNNIFKDNGDTNTEWNVNDAFGGPVLTRNSCYSISGGRSGLNIRNSSQDASDITGDPLFTDPDNATSSLRDFTLQNGSPALAAAWTFEGSTVNTSSPDMGALQSAGSGGGGGLLGNANKRANMQ